MPKYAKFLKSLLTNKSKLEEAYTVMMNERCSAVLLNKLPSKEKDPVSFTIPCHTSDLHINNGLADLGASISLIPYTMYEKLGLGEPKPTRMSLEIPDSSEPEKIITEPVIRRIDSLDTAYPGEHQNDGPDKIKSEHLYSVLENHKGAMAWKMSDIKGISPSFYVVKNEILKLLDSRLIYPISDSSWVSPIHVVPKTRGMTVVLNDNNELIPSRMVIGWRVCINYRKLNDATRKDHFTLPFIDQMFERLSGNDYYCFLDGFSGFFQIPFALEDQEKTIFTCPYGTFSYRRMPFGLCNALVTFQQCMTIIFHDTVKDFIEVFMDDFSVFANSFDSCLVNLDKMLARCKETNLVLNWEKYHFMASEAIVLEHKISRLGIEDAKPRLIRWVLLLQEFNIEIKDKKGEENLAAYHLSRLENPNMEDEPYAFRLCADNVMRRCVGGSEILEILAHCHSGPTGGHHSAPITGRKPLVDGDVEEDGDLSLEAMEDEAVTLVDGVFKGAFGALRDEW
ncbi:reverse transcriptase domain-containing protein [Tanacetum coccineum]|uniref:Reverse transcriptase domain-containing protein n=1 Tax=Tanacetum coccineum TaxID=301880 RepID=A0ABQ4YZE9_9ASTR